MGTATGGMADAISDGETGLLIDMNELPGTTARRMLEVGTREKYTAMAEACWKKWHDRFAMESVLERLTQILEQAAASTTTKP